MISFSRREKQSVDRTKQEARKAAWRSKMLNSEITKAIVENFPGKSNAGLRAELRSAADSGSVMGLSRRIALTISGKMGLEAVERAIKAASVVAE